MSDSNPARLSRKFVFVAIGAVAALCAPLIVWFACEKATVSERIAMLKRIQSGGGAHHDFAYNHGYVKRRPYYPRLWMDTPVDSIALPESMENETSRARQLFPEADVSVNYPVMAIDGPYAGVRFGLGQIFDCAERSPGRDRIISFYYLPPIEEWDARSSRWKRQPPTDRRNSDNRLVYWAAPSIGPHRIELRFDPDGVARSLAQEWQQAGMSAATTESFEWGIAEKRKESASHAGQSP